MNNAENNDINHTDLTDAELEAEFIERNNNLRKSLNHVVDKIDSASLKTHDYLAQNVANETTVSTDGNAAPKSSAILEQTNASSSSTGFGIRTMNEKLMKSIKSDINAMHSVDAEQFEDVATKMDETFGLNALI